MDNQQDFTTGAIYSKLLGFMVPALLALMLQSLYGAVDTLIIGRFGTLAGISGVSVGSNVMMILGALFGGLSVGVTVLIGVYLGQSRTDRITALIGNSTFFYLVAVSVASVLLVIFARPLANLLQTPPEAVDSAVTYIRICGAGFIFTNFYYYVSGIFRAMGNSKLPLLFVAIACVVNIFGDLLLVAVFKMDVAGAAIATVFAQALSLFLSLRILRKKDLPFTFSLKEIRPGPEIGRFVKIGLPVGLQEILTSLTFTALCAFVNKMGLAASSGYGVAGKITGFIMLVPSAIMECMSPFVSQNVGACREDRARKGMLYGMLTGAGVGAVFCLTTIFFGDRIAGLFTTDAGCIGCAALYLKGFAADCVLTPLLFSLMGYFNGHARSGIVMWQGLAQSLLVRLPVSWYFSTRASLTGVGLACPLATAFGIALCMVFYFRLQKELDAQ